MRSQPGPQSSEPAREAPHGLFPSPLPAYPNQVLLAPRAPLPWRVSMSLHCYQHAPDLYSRKSEYTENAPSTGPFL